MNGRELVGGGERVGDLLQRLRVSPAENEFAADGMKGFRAGSAHAGTGAGHDHHFALPSRRIKKSYHSFLKSCIPINDTIRLKSCYVRTENSLLVLYLRLCPCSVIPFMYIKGFYFTMYAFRNNEHPPEGSGDSSGLSSARKSTEAKVG